MYFTLFLADSHSAQDIIFLLDSSDSIGQDVFENGMIPFVRDFIHQSPFLLDSNHTQIGVVGFANGQHIDIPLRNTYTKHRFASMLKVIYKTAKLTMFKT
jgi:hypothetical protein